MLYALANCPINVLTSAGFRKLLARVGEAAGMTFPVHPAHAAPYSRLQAGEPRCRYALAQHYLGHKNIQHTVRYSKLAADRFKDFWRD
jgi:type 1 fimbriae regulatory protein FimB/type 1 fimbriae regulatory protein FimE